MAKRITAQQSSPALEDTDVVATAKSAEDYKATLTQLFTYVLSKLTADQVMDLIQTVDSNTSGLNSNFLQGNDSAFFRNGSNINDGVVDALHLPQDYILGGFTTLFQTGGDYTNAGQLRNVIKFPDNFLGLGNRIMVQFGHSYFTGYGVSTSLTFPEAFASGWSNENKPVVIATTENRANGWSGDTPLTPAPDNIELYTHVWYSDLTKFSYSTGRHSGSGSDKIRINYIAIGRY